MSQFDELLAQLNAEQEEQSTLAKALPADDGEDDQAIQAAAAEGAEGEDNPEDEDDDAEGGEAPLTKSMKIGDEEVELVDAEALIKSIGLMDGRVTEVESVLVKGLESALGMIKSQGDMIKSLQGQITKLGTQGAGRKAVLTVHEKPNTETPLTKSQPDGELTKEQFLVKSEAAWNAGVINGVEFSSVDVALRTGNKLDAGLIQRIVNHK